MLCGAHQLGLLACVDAGGSAAKCSAAAQPDLDKDMCFAIQHDEVDFAKAAGVVHLQQLQALTLQILRGQLLGLRT